jgi:hypothetical protein
MFCVVVISFTKNLAKILDAVVDTEQVASLAAIVTEKNGIMTKTVFPMNNLHAYNVLLFLLGVIKVELVRQKEHAIVAPSHTL